MRVIRFTPIFHGSAPSQVISDVPLMNPTGHAQAAQQGPRASFPIGPQAPLFWKLCPHFIQGTRLSLILLPTGHALIASWSPGSPSSAKLFTMESTAVQSEVPSASLRRRCSISQAHRLSSRHHQPPLQSESQHLDCIPAEPTIPSWRETEKERIRDGDSQPWPRPCSRHEGTHWATDPTLLKVRSQAWRVFQSRQSLQECNDGR